MVQIHPRAPIFPNLYDKLSADHPDLLEFMDAIDGEGDRAYDWNDKPHRLVYDLVKLVVAEREKNAMLRHITSYTVTPHHMNTPGK